MNGIDSAAKSHQQFQPTLQVAALQRHLSDDEIHAICRQLGHVWRDRTLPPGVTVRSLVYRSLHQDKSIKAVLADLASASQDIACEVTDSAWCQARSRLPEDLMNTLIRRSDCRLYDMVGQQYFVWGRPIFLVDGSTVSMPDTPDLAEEFGYADGQRGQGRFPMARMTFITRAGVESIFDYRIGPYRQSEETQFHQMRGNIDCGAIVLADRKFCSFHILAKLRQKDIGMIVPLHQRRDPLKLINRGDAIGKDQWIVTFDLDPQMFKKYDDPSLPKQISVRLIRVRYRKNGKRKQMWLVTTLLDTQRYRRRDITALYLKRWGIETRIGSVKTTLDMGVLRSKTAAAVGTEVAATILAHNLTWTVIHQAAQQTDTPADRISFAGTIKTILSFSHSLRVTSGPQRAEIYVRMLDHVASHINLDRPGRSEPRMIKRVKRQYPDLKTTRQRAREGLS
jgi:hypothetical protein